MCQMLKLVVVAVLVNACSAKIAPDFVTVCPGLKEDCLKSRIQEAIPHFTKGIEPLGIITTDPLIEDNVNLELPGAFTIQLIKGRMTGLKGCIVEKAKFVNDEAQMSLRCNVTIVGKYKANGQIFIVTINGDGDAEIVTTDIIFNVRVKFTDKERDGKVYYEIIESKIKHKIAGRVQFNLTNLFKGNPELGNTVLLFLNENWEQVVKEFGGPIFDRLVKIIFGTIKRWFHIIPKNELF